MRWGDFRRSDNVDDRTGEASGADSGGGFPLGGGMRLGGGALVVIVVASLIFGVNPLEMIGMMEGGVPSAPPQSRPPSSAPGYGPQYAPPAVAAACGQYGQRSGQGLRRRRSRRHRRRVASGVQDDERALRAAAARAVSGGDAIGMRSSLGVERDRSIARPIGSSTSTPRSLPSFRADSALPAISPRRM